MTRDHYGYDEKIRRLCTDLELTARPVKGGLVVIGNYDGDELAEGTRAEIVQYLWGLAAARKMIERMGER